MVTTPLETSQTNTQVLASPEEAWELAISDLRREISKVHFDTWVSSLRPLGYQNHIFTVAANNPYAREWVEKRIKSTLAHKLEGLYAETVQLEIVVSNGFYRSEEGEERSFVQQEPVIVAEPPPPPEEPVAKPAKKSSTRKAMLQRAYGNERARVVQPERSLFITRYFFSNWLPLLGHSAAMVIVAARSLCYWNPEEEELRNEIDTDMSDLARRAAVSVRTVKDVLANEMVQRYFLRYRVRRVMTSNGIRTAGISLLVRMDEPLTPQDQEAHNLIEEQHWYPLDYEDEEEEV